MSAIIELWIDGEVQRDFWIEKKVIRLGSGSDCDLRIDDPAVSSHLGTLRFRNGAYVFYNRSGDALQIGGQPVESDGSAKWNSDESLECSDGLNLQLRIDGDPSPTPQQDNEVLEYIQEQREEEQRLKSVQDAEAAKELEQESVATTGRSGNQNLIGVFLLGIAAIGLLGLAAFWMLMPEHSSKPGFRATRVVNKLLPHASQLPPRLVQMMQEAQQSVVLGDAVMGKQRLHRLQAELDSLKASGDPLTIDQNGKQISYEEALRAYINEYLSQLE